MDGKANNVNSLRRIGQFPPVRILLFGLLCALPLLIAMPIIVSYTGRSTDPYTLGIYTTAILAPSSILALWIMARFVDRRPFAETGIAVHGVFFETAIGVVIGFALVSLTVTILSAAGYYHATGHDSGFQVGAIAFFYLGVAICEEVIYRGYILQSLESRWGTAVAVVVTCTVFGIEHIGNVEPESNLHMVKVVLFLGFGAGGLFAAAYLMTRRLWLPIGLHWAWNFFMGAYYGLPVSGSNLTGSYLQSTLAGPRYLTGEKFGPECSVITLAIAWAIAGAMLVVAIRNRHWKLHPRLERERQHALDEKSNVGSLEANPQSGD